MSVAVLEPLPETLASTPAPAARAPKKPRCEFNSLGEVINVEFEQCPNAAVWRTPLGSCWCEEHRPSWTKPGELERVDGELPSVDHLGSELQRNGNVLARSQTNRPGSVGHKPNNPNWPLGRAGGGEFL